jgi:Xaa-Pro aminopeptidase
VRSGLHAVPADALLVTHLPNIRYLTGFAGTAGAVILLQQRCLLMVDSRYVTAARALASPLPDGLLAVEPVANSYDEAIAQAVTREGIARLAIEAAHLTVARFNALAALIHRNNPRPATTNGRPTTDERPAHDGLPTAGVLLATERVVERVRMVKDAAEVATFREAASRLSAIARRLGEMAVPGRTEREVADLIEDAMRRAGFSHPAFDTIVASGPNSALPHASPTDRRLQSGDPTVLDFGGVYSGYCVDLTRTVQLGGISGEPGRLFAAVAEAQKAAIAAVGPGARPSQVDGAARAVLERHGLGEAFGHGTGHGLGLEIHEDPRVGRPMANQPDDPLEPGVVITIEPGAYVPGIGGVRIEDDVLVTANGCEVLTDVPTFL